MRVRLLSLFVCLSTVGIVPAASAGTLDFTFSFTGTNYSLPGNPSGTVTGEIVGLSDNATSSATAIYIDTADNNIKNDTLPYNALSTMALVFKNSFTVSNGVITAANLFILTANGDRTEPDFESLTLNNSQTNQLTIGPGGLANNSGFGGTTYALVPSVAVAPEPASMTFLLEGLGAGACLGWRRLRRARQASHVGMGGDNRRTVE
jgi:hypothetical protein